MNLYFAHERYVNLTVVDIFDDRSPTVMITLRYIGSNDSSPVSIAGQHFVVS